MVCSAPTIYRQRYIRLESPKQADDASWRAFWNRERLLWDSAHEFHGTWLGLRLDAKRPSASILAEPLQHVFACLFTWNLVSACVSMPVCLYLCLYACCMCVCLSLSLSLCGCVCLYNALFTYYCCLSSDLIVNVKKCRSIVAAPGCM